MSIEIEEYPKYVGDPFLDGVIWGGGGKYSNREINLHINDLPLPLVDKLTVEFEDRYFDIDVQEIYAKQSGVLLIMKVVSQSNIFTHLPKMSDRRLLKTHPLDFINGFLLSRLYVINDRTKSERDFKLRIRPFGSEENIVSILDFLSIKYKKQNNSLEIIPSEYEKHPFSLYMESIYEEMSILNEQIGTSEVIIDNLWEEAKLKHDEKKVTIFNENVNFELIDHLLHNDDIELRNRILLYISKFPILEVYNTFPNNLSLDGLINKFMKIELVREDNELMRNSIRKTIFDLTKDGLIQFRNIKTRIGNSNMTIAEITDMGKKIVISLFEYYEEEALVIKNSKNINKKNIKKSSQDLEKLNKIVNKNSIPDDVDRVIFDRLILSLRKMRDKNNSIIVDEYHHYLKERYRYDNNQITDYISILLKNRIIKLISSYDKKEKKKFEKIVITNEGLLFIENIEKEKEGKLCHQCNERQIIFGHFCSDYCMKEYLKNKKHYIFPKRY